MKSRYILSMLALATLSAGQVGCGGDVVGGGPPPSPTPTAEAVAEAPLNPDKILKVWRDSSASTNEDEIKRALSEVIASIRRNLHSIDGVEVVLFANGDNSIWSEGTVKFIWGQRPIVKPFVPPNLENAPLTARMYEAEKNEYIAATRANYDRDNATAFAAYDARVNDELQKFERYVMQQPRVSAPCTKFSNLKLRIENENRSKNLIFTDGWADCGDRSSGNPSNFTGKVTILLVTRRRDRQADEGAFAQRQEYMRQMFPGAVVIPAYIPEKAVDTLLK